MELSIGSSWYELTFSGRVTVGHDTFPYSLWKKMPRDLDAVQFNRIVSGRPAEITDKKITLVAAVLPDTILQVRPQSDAMIYVATLKFLLMLLAIPCGVALMSRISGRFRSASGCMIGGVIGAVLGWLLLPLAGVVVGLVPAVLVEPQYFIERFVGCIAPFPLFLGVASCFLGAFAGFAGGVFSVIHRRRRHAA